MTLAVLNNRLLQLTDRKFKPSNYGATTLRDALESLAPRVVVVTEDGQPIVELRGVQTVSAKDAPPSPVASDLPNTSQHNKEEAIIQGGRVREDLWVAAMDYTSGRLYVWDEVRGIAREAVQSDEQPKFPTVTREELDRWRGDFLELNSKKLNSTDRAMAERWYADRLPTAGLPVSLQQKWNKELTRRVRYRVHTFFSSQANRFGNRRRGASTSTSLVGETLFEEKLGAARASGDYFTAGDLLLNHAKQHDPRFLSMLSGAITAWASSKESVVQLKSIQELIGNLHLFSAENIGTSLVNIALRLKKNRIAMPGAVSDLVFRIRDALTDIYDVDSDRSPVEVCNSAMIRLEAATAQLESSIERFMRTTAATAKIASIDVLKKYHVLSPMLISAEREFLLDLEILIGPAFRKLCEAYERNDDAQVLRRAPEFLENVKRHTPGPRDSRRSSGIWNSVVAPVLDHLSEIITDAMSRGEVALAPTLELRNSTTKADLRLVDREINLSFSLMNSGHGHAYDISLQGSIDDPGIHMSLAEPVGPFDVAPDAEQLVRVRLVLSKPLSSVSVPIKWICITSVGKETSFAGEIIVTQQVTEPDWDSLIADPPYSLNPVKRPDRLYGRDSILRKLTLAAMSGASTFVWGQKRIGKTSLLQVLASKLQERDDTTCILLRMGEISSLHEGQLGRLMAQKLVDLSKAEVVIPSEAEFGAGLGKLIGVVETLCAQQNAQKFVVIIDEFDDLDPTFYTGERGKQFIKALRSASEAGLTFFFVGSERMEAIYQRHQADLNKWTNVRLDRIDSRTDCKALITVPVLNAVEYSQEAINFIVDYCGGNPFYIHNFCYQLFDRCLQEHRTFIDDNDTDAVRQQLLRALGQTNFSHLWEDNPILDQDSRRRAAAVNSIALTCIATLGGKYEDPEELLEVQESLPLDAGDRATSSELRAACEKLLAREILALGGESKRFAITLQIFREWLAENAVSKLIPIWTAYKESERLAAVQHTDEGHSIRIRDDQSFVISEDDMISVSQRLMFCGRQKDVADIRSWLRQFDDDARIETAFLLLKRLAERGFINEGARSLALAKLEEMIGAKRREIGKKAWRVLRGRLDNLCLTYVDSELKSGAAITRELRSMIRPGKSGAHDEVAGWMRSHVENDPIVIVADDFAGTGTTLANGLKRFRDEVDSATWNRYVDEGRLAVFVMFAFPEALDHIRKEFPGPQIVAANILGDDLRACSNEAQIFESESELIFAKEILLQIGRELYSAAPLGFGDLGALVSFHNAVPNNTLPIFWSNGRVGERPWKPIFPRA